jgi:hypothetical protein
VTKKYYIGGTAEPYDSQGFAYTDSDHYALKCTLNRQLFYNVVNPYALVAVLGTDATVTTPVCVNCWWVA